MLHYNEAMTLNVGNDWLLCKVFSASLPGAGPGLVSQAPALLNKFVQRTMSRIHITIPLLGVKKEKH